MEHNKLIFSKVPTLRFAEYTDEWHKYALSNFVTRITRRNKNNESSLPLTISAQYGLVDQITFFNKTVASVDLSGYYLLYNGDFAYNKSYSNDYAWGAVKRLDKYEKGCLSSLYFVFRPTDKVDSDYLTHYFETSKWHKGISDIAGEGARNHGLLNMAVDDYFATKHYLPSLSEQKKIACFLNLITKRIEIQNKIISKYETLIKGLKNQLYSRKARFTSHNKIPFPKWEKKQLSEILSISTEKNGSQYSKEKVLSVSDEYGVVNQIKFQGKSFAGQDISNYKVVKSGQIIYTRSPLAAKPFGIIKIVGNEIGIVSPLYIVNTVNNGYDALFVFYLFDTPQSTNNYLKPLVRVGAKHTMNISNDEWLSGTVIIPCLEEQKMIAGVLQSIDKKISFEKKVLEILKEQKTYLLSKMFI